MYEAATLSCADCLPAALTEEDVEGDLELTFDRWFLTGFIAGLIRKHKDAVLYGLTTLHTQPCPQAARVTRTHKHLYTDTHTQPQTAS